MTLDQIRKMSPGSRLLLVIEGLTDRAHRLRTMEEALVRMGVSSGWSDEALAEYRAMGAAADALRRIYERGHSAHARNVKPEPAVADVLDVVGSALISDTIGVMGAPPNADAA